MSSISTDVFTSDDPPSDVAGLLAHGALVIAQSREARSRTRHARLCATWLRHAAHSVMLRFSGNHLHLISGADDFDEEPQRIRSALRAFAVFGTPKTFVGLSRGATCDACGRMILGGEIEYELVTDGHEMRLESGCNLLLVDVLTAPAPGADAPR